MGTTLGIGGAINFSLMLTYALDLLSWGAMTSFLRGFSSFLGGFSSFLMGFPSFLAAFSSFLDFFSSFLKILSSFLVDFYSFLGFSTFLMAFLAELAIESGLVLAVTGCVASTTGISSGFSSSIVLFFLAITG
jgi:hypothetical protein